MVVQPAHPDLAALPRQAPLGGVIMADVYILRKRHISLPDLFTTHRSCYWYHKGFNWRAIVAFTLGVVPSLPGFIRSINPTLGIPFEATFVYCAVYPVGVVVAGGLHLALSYTFPPAPLPTMFSALDYADSLGGERGAGRGGSAATEEEKEKESAVGSTVVAV